MSEALKHWKYVRLSAIAAIPLTLWLVCCVVFCGVTADHATFVSWLSDPVNSAIVILNIVIVFYHAASGAQEMIEDYVHHETLKSFGIRALYSFFALAGAACIFFTSKIAFGG